jgi:hypothetical protein
LLMVFFDFFLWIGGWEARGAGVAFVLLDVAVFGVHGGKLVSLCDNGVLTGEYMGYSSTQTVDQGRSIYSASVADPPINSSGAVRTSAAVSVGPVYVYVRNIRQNNVARRMSTFKLAKQLERLYDAPEGIK